MKRVLLMQPQTTNTQTIAASKGSFSNPKEHPLDPLLLVDDKYIKLCFALYTNTTNYSSITCEETVKYFDNQSIV
jgi:hypothetical protein